MTDPGPWSDLSAYDRPQRGNVMVNRFDALTRERLREATNARPIAELRLRAGARRPLTGPALMLIANPDEAPTGPLLAVVHALEHGQVVVQPTPGPRGRSDHALLKLLGLDVLEALGKDTQQLEGCLGKSPAWDLAAAWIEGEAVTDLIIDRAHLLPDAALESLHAFTCQCGIRLWLLWGSDQVLPDGLRERATRTNLDGLARRFAPPRGIAAHLPRQDYFSPITWPSLPSADFTTFMAVTQRTTTSEDFKEISRLYAYLYFHACRLARHVQRTLNDPPSASSQPPGTVADAIGRVLRDNLIGPSSTPSEALIALRATQAGLFSEGIFLRWRPRGLGPRPEDALPSGLTPHIAAVLRAHPWPQPAADIALALHLGDLYGALHPSGQPIRTIHLHRGSDEISAADGASNDVTVPNYAVPIFRAQIAWRRHDGAGPDDELLTGLPKNRRRDQLSPSLAVAAHYRIHQRSLRSDYHFRERFLGRDYPHHRWMAARGLSIHLLPTSPSDLAAWTIADHDTYATP